MSYLISYSDIKDNTISNVSDKLIAVKGLKLSDAKLSNFVFDQNGKAILTGNGVYIFKKGNEAKYVGSCSSRNFVERIPAHFDVRRQGWFNSMTKKMVKVEIEKLKKEGSYESQYEKDGKISTEAIIKMTKEAINDFEVVMINFEDYDKEAILSLEKLLRIELEPLNTFKHNPVIDKEMLVHTYKR